VCVLGSDVSLSERPFFSGVKSHGSPTSVLSTGAAFVFEPPGLMGKREVLMETDDETDGNLSNEPWSATDEEDLREALSSGATLDDVASFLCRDLLDVAERALALGLGWRYGRLH